MTAPTPPSHWSALPVLLAGTFLVVLDFFIVNVALPSMQSDLHASTGAIEWVVAGYALQAGLVFTILAVAYLATSMKGPALTLRLRKLTVHVTVNLRQ